jgi:hypothetical protein
LIDDLDRLPQQPLVWSRRHTFCFVHHDGIIARRWTIAIFFVR